MSTMAYEDDIRGCMTPKAWFPYEYDTQKAHPNFIMNDANWQNLCGFTNKLK